MDRRIQLLCAWCGPAFLLQFLLAFWVLAGLVTAPPAGDGAARIARFYGAQLKRGVAAVVDRRWLIAPWRGLRPPGRA
jgi:hypothetical protein